MSLRVVLITGCSTGIGYALAILLAKDPNKSFKVYATVLCKEDEVQLKETVGEYLDTTLIVEELDVRYDISVEALVKKIIAKEGRIDILVNNAGIELVGIMEVIPMDVVRNVFETNVFGTMRMMRAVIPHMKSRMEGHVVNLSSTAGLVGFPFLEYYTASKFAVEGFSEAMAPILEKFNIKLSVVEPGKVATPLLQRFVTGKDKYDFSQVDEKTKNLYEKVFDTTVPVTIQSADEIADLIKSILQTHQQPPHFRYLTGEDNAPNVFKAKFADICGDSVVSEISQRFFPEKTPEE